MDVDVSLDYGLTLLAALLIGTGFVLQQHAAQGEPASRFLSLRLITDLLRQPRWLAGIGCMIGGQILAAWSIGNLSLAFVEPLLTTNLVFALVLPLYWWLVILREKRGGATEMARERISRYGCFSGLARVRQFGNFQPDFGQVADQFRRPAVDIMLLNDAAHTIHARLPFVGRHLERLAD